MCTCRARSRARCLRIKGGIVSTLAALHLRVEVDEGLNDCNHHEQIEVDLGSRKSALLDLDIVVNGSWEHDLFRHLQDNHKCE